MLGPCKAPGEAGQVLKALSAWLSCFLCPKDSGEISSDYYEVTQWVWDTAGLDEPQVSWS